jgi:hypothetical protein
MKSMARFQFRDCTKLTSSWDWFVGDGGLALWLVNPNQLTRDSKRRLSP